MWGTSVRISRLNIIRAIRDTPDAAAADQPSRTCDSTLPVWSSARRSFAFGVVRSEPLAALLGPSLAALCLVPLLTTRLSRRLAISLPSLALLGYGVLAFSLVAVGVR